MPTSIVSLRRRSCRHAIRPRSASESKGSTPSLGTNPQFRFLEPIRKQRGGGFIHPFRGAAFLLGADGVEIDEPRLEQRLRDGFERGVGFAQEGRCAVILRTREPLSRPAVVGSGDRDAFDVLPEVACAARVASSPPHAAGSHGPEMGSRPRGVLIANPDRALIVRKRAVRNENFGTYLPYTRQRPKTTR